MSVTTVEERLVALELEMDQLKKEMSSVTPPAKIPWWARHVGAFENSPNFESAMKRATEYRRSQPTPTDQIDNVPS